MKNLSGRIEIAKETVDLYLNGEHEIKYDNILKDFLKRGIVNVISINRY
jgi:hypothetical protein